ncbi:unnamed protein product [Somion occarium]|uniref:F-box domain-containing protein n=1 Tax=Somion occarium TaxID=3059160 RepID=A0ABP1EAP9_9APHY
MVDSLLVPFDVQGAHPPLQGLHDFCFKLPAELIYRIVDHLGDDRQTFIICKLTTLKNMASTMPLPFSSKGQPRFGLYASPICVRGSRLRHRGRTSSKCADTEELYLSGHGHTTSLRRTLATVQESSSDLDRDLPVRELVLKCVRLDYSVPSDYRPSRLLR